MLRYHKEVLFKAEDLKALESLTGDLNDLNWQYTRHCLYNLQHRVIDLKSLLLYVKNLTLNFQDIFEFYKDDLSGDIIKVCYRLEWQGNLDLILVLDTDKIILSIYVNSTEDKHETLKRELYINE
jgi:hypothetical protein